MREIYTHKFKHGVTATMTISDNPPSMNVEWDGLDALSAATRLQLLSEYQAWRNHAMAIFARKTGQRVLTIDL